MGAAVANSARFLGLLFSPGNSCNHRLLLGDDLADLVRGHEALAHRQVEQAKDVRGFVRGFVPFVQRLVQVCDNEQHKSGSYRIGRHG